MNVIGENGDFIKRSFPPYIHYCKQQNPSQGQKYRVGNSLFLSFAQNSSYYWALAIHSRRSLQRSNRERIPLVTLNKRATMSDLLRSFMTKEIHWSKLSRHSVKMSNMSDSQKKNHIFCMFLTGFHCFSPFLCQRANRERRSLLSRSFLNSYGSHSLLTKERLWLNSSLCSLQKSDRDQFAPVASDKRATGAIRSFSWAIRSFAHKKQAIRSKTSELIPNPAKILVNKNVLH